MPVQIDHTHAPDAEDGVILSWTSHLALEQPLKLTCSIALVTLAAWAAYYAIGPLASIVVAVAMVASISDFLFPVRYVITRECASCRMLTKSAEIRWANVRKCYRDKYGVKLSPLARRSRLEAFRGVYLRFSGNEGEVVSTVESLAVGRC